MKDKIYLGIIVFLIFAVVISFTAENAETTELKDKISKLEKLEQANDELEKKISSMDEKFQEISTELAMKTAAQFKRKQYTVDYSEDYKETYYQQMEGFKEFTTEKGLQRITQSATIARIYRLSSETKSNLSVKDISFKVGETENKNEVSLDYDIEIVINPVSNEGKKRTATNFGQLQVIKTEDGWKVDKDIDRMNGTSVLLDEILSE